MHVVEAPPARHQPAHGEGRIGADGERPLRIAAAQLLGRQAQSVERFLDLPGIDLSARRQLDRAVAAGEQPHPERRLQRLDLPADRSRRHREIGRGAGEVQAARGGIEGTQGIKWRQARDHRSVLS